MSRYMLPHPVQCTACGVRWQTGENHGRPLEVGALMVCIECAHCMVMGSDWHMYDLSREQAATVATHWNFPNIRAFQDRVIQERRLWG